MAGATAVFINVTAAGSDLLRYLAKYAGRTAQMSPDFEKLTGRPATTFASWASEHTSGFLALAG